MNIQIPFPVLFVIDQLQSSGYEAYVVGGAVRDLLMGKERITDWDVTTSATPEQIQELLPESFYDNAFGTVMIAPKHVMEQAGVEVDEENFAYADFDVLDITTFRTENGYSDRRRPDKVSWGKSLEEDVARRDFTINAIAMKAKNEELKAEKSVGFVETQVEVIDYHGGQEDLKQRLVRAVGDADVRFKEDALRMMRAIRIAAQLGFGIESATMQAIRQDAKLIGEISGERIRVELFKILETEYPADGVKLLYAAGLLQEILPELVEGVEVPQGGRHKYDVWTHGIESLRECPSRDPLVRLATLLHDVGKPRTLRKQGPRGVTFYGHEVVGAHMCNRIADRLKLSKKQKEKLFLLVRWHMFTYDTEMTDSAIRRFIRRIGRENINDMMMLRIGDRKGGGSKATSWRLRELQQRIGENLYEPVSIKDLKTNGTEVMEKLGIEPGPKVGVVLNQLFEEVMDDKIANDKEVLLNRAQEIVKEL